MSLRATVALALLTIALPAPSSAQSRTAADYMATVEGAQSSAGPNDLGELTIQELLERFNVPGVSIAVIHDFKIHWAKGYGVADVETGAPVDTETMFQAASISKPVAAMGVLRAVQDGLFTLDDDINDILESWRLDGGEFTRDRPVTPRGASSPVRSTPCAAWRARCPRVPTRAPTSATPPAAPGWSSAARARAIRPVRSWAAPATCSLRTASSSCCSAN